MNENWGELTPLERAQFISRARENPCPEDNHVYEDMVISMGQGTMLNQVCKICFDIQGWIYNWDTRG